MTTDLLNIIKQAGMEAIEASKPVKILFGEVTAVKPLQIMVEQKLPLSEDFLILTNAVKDHWIEMTVDHMTENASGGSGDSAYAAHKHQYVGRKRFLVHNDLIVGEHVMLMAMQGGQKFVVVDRVVKA